MSAPLDVAAQNATLDALLGDSAGASMPSQYEFALYAGDPANGGVEVDSLNGYVRPVIDSDSAQWPDAVDGIKTGTTIPFADPSGAWTADGAVQWITHFVLFDHADSTTRYFPRPLTEPFIVPAARSDLAVQPVLTWNTEGS